MPTEICTNRATTINYRHTALRQDSKGDFCTNIMQDISYKLALLYHSMGANDKPSVYSTLFY